MGGGPADAASRVGRGHVERAKNGVAALHVLRKSFLSILFMEVTTQLCRDEGF